MQQIRMLSLKCSSLIDVLKFDYYNIHMEENTVVNLLAMETVEPKWRVTRSAGAVYFVLIALMLGCISLGNMLYANWQIPRHITQPILYGLIAICGVSLYRRHFICFRYTFTDEQFAIEQTGGSKEKTIAEILIRDIRQISSHAEVKRVSGKTVDASLPPREATSWIFATVDGNDIAYCISASEAFLDTMKQQMLTHNHSNEPK